VFFSPTTCNDNNPCTDDSCNSTTGCVYTKFNDTERCFGGDTCMIYFCDPTIGCTSKPRVCENIYNDSCIEPYCDKTGCQFKPFECPPGSDPNCFITYCNSSRIGDKCHSEELDSCALVKILGGSAAVVLGVGAIIAIIAGIVVCVGASAAGAVAGYNFVYKGDFANKNPLFEAETQTGKSEIYDGKK